MDQDALVKSGQALVRELDNSGIPPRAAMWVENGETNIWKLWIVPHKKLADKREFYRRVAEIISKHRPEITDLDAADVEMTDDIHPAIEGMKRMLKMPGLGIARFKNNRLNGFFLLDGIVLRMDL